MRGKIYNPKRNKQLIDASGLAYGKCTITDVDGGLEFCDRALVLFEIKYGDAQMPEGQNAMLRRIINAWNETGRHGIIIEAHHDIDDPEAEIPLHDCIVRRVYVDRGWSYRHEGKRVKEVVDSFLDESGIDVKTGQRKAPVSANRFVYEESFC